MPVTLVTGDMLDTVQIQAGKPAVPIATRAARGGLQAVLARIAAAAESGLQHGLGPIGLVAQDDVDHAGHGIGPIDGRGTAAYQFDAVDEAQRNAAEVGEPTLFQRHHGITRQAPAVDQEQRRPRAHAVQAGGGRCTHRQVLRIAAARGTHGGMAVHAGQVPQQVEQIAVATAQDVVAIDGGDRQCGLHRRARQPAAGDVDGCQFHLVWRVGGPGSRVRQARGCDRFRWRGRWLGMDTSHDKGTRGRAQDVHWQAGDQQLQGGPGIALATCASGAQIIQFTCVEQQGGATLPGPLLQCRYQWARTHVDLQRAGGLAGIGHR